MQSPKLEYKDNTPSDPLYTYDDLQSSDELERKQKERLEKERLAAIELRKQNSQGKFDELMNKQIPSPYFNEKLAKEPLKMSRNNAIAKGFSVIGDMVNLGARAKVNRRQPDNMEAKYMNDFYRNMEMYGAKVDNWNARNSDREYRNAVMGIQNDNRQEDLAYRDKQEVKKDAEIERKWKWEEGRPEREIAQLEKEGKIKEAQQLRIMEQQHKNRLSEYGVRYDGRTGRTSSDSTGNKQIEVIGPDKKVYGFTEAEANDYIYRALSKGTVDKVMEIAPHLFEKVETAKDLRGQPVYEMQLKKGVKDEDIIRAYMEVESKQQPVQDKATLIKYPGAPLREGETLPDQSKYPKWEGKQQGQKTQTKVPSFFQ